jgi:hypothetical protein
MPWTLVGERPAGGRPDRACAAAARAYGDTTRFFELAWATDCEAVTTCKALGEAVCATAAKECATPRVTIAAHATRRTRPHLIAANII